MASQNNTESAVSSKRLWAGRIMIALPVLFFLFDIALHISNIPPVMEAMTQLGYSANLAPSLGILELACLILYVIPRTSVLGAILLTGYLGGAVASNLRIGSPLFSHILFPVYLGLFVWGGLYLSNKKLAVLIPLRKN